jgi:hypothetical protein
MRGETAVKLNSAAIATVKMSSPAAAFMLDVMQTENINFMARHGDVAYLRDKETGKRADSDKIRIRDELFYEAIGVYGMLESQVYETAMDILLLWNSMFIMTDIDDMDCMIEMPAGDFLLPVPATLGYSEKEEGVAYTWSEIISVYQTSTDGSKVKFILGGDHEKKTNPSIDQVRAMHTLGYKCLMYIDLADIANDYPSVEE